MTSETRNYSDHSSPNGTFFVRSTSKPQKESKCLKSRQIQVHVCYCLLLFLAASNQIIAPFGEGLAKNSHNRFGEEIDL